MADFRVIIKSLIDNRTAYKNLADLKKNVQRTSREISKLDTQQANLGTKRSKLVQQLEKAKKAAEEAQTALENAGDAYNAKFYKVRAGLRNNVKYQALNPEQKNSFVEKQVAKQYPETSSIYLAAEKSATTAQAAVDRLNKSLADNSAESERVRNLQAGLRQTLDQQQGALDRASNSAGRISGLFARLQQSASGLKRTLGQGLVGAFRKADGAVKRFANHLLRGNKFAKTFSSRLRRILMGALIFNAVSAALRNLVSGMGAALRQNTALSTAMANLKGAAYQCVAPLAAMLAPALTMVANAAAIALSYLAKLLSFFTGKSLAATKAEAAAIGAVGSAAKKAGKSLAAFDTINQLSSNDSGSGAQTITPNFSYEAQSPFLDQVKAAIEAGDWAGAGKLLADKLNSMVDDWDARAWGKRLGKKLNNGISFLYAFLIAFNWVALGGKLADAFNGMAEMIDWGHLGALFVAGISIALQLLAGFLANLDWAALGVDLSLFVQGALDELTRAISNADPAAIGAGIAQFIANIDWMGIATSAWELLLTALQSTQELLIAFFSELFGENVGAMLGTFTTIALGIALALGAIAAAAGLLNIAIGLLTSPITLVVAAMAALIAIIVLVVQHWDELKATASDVWDGVTTTTKGAVNSIIGFINGMISAVTNGINAVIRALNSIQIDIPSWVPGLGGRHFGINMAELTAPQIPYLAQGAVIPANREFLAVLGDQKHGTNIEAPADLIRSIVREEIGGLQVTIRFEGNLAQLGRVLRPVIDTERKRKGATLIKGGTY